jgi:hypothetical protein
MNGPPPGCHIQLIRLMQTSRRTQERPAQQARDLPSSAVFRSGRWARALPAPQTPISSGSEAEVVDQLSDTAFDVVASRRYSTTSFRQAKAKESPDPKSLEDRSQN